MLSGAKRSLGLLCVFVVTCVQLAFCQPYYFSHYQVENGLSNNAVMCSLQDHNGFMWFGTRDGLNRFDGLQFKVFRNDPENANSIGSNGITSLYQDEDNILWAGTEKGIYKFDEMTERFSQLKIAGDYSIRDLKVIKGNIWYISLYTLYRYNEKTGNLKRFTIDKEVTAYSVMKDNALWIATASGTIALYDDGKGAFSEHNLFSKTPVPVSKWIESIFDTGTGVLLIGTSNGGLKSFDIKSSSYKDILTYNPDKTEIIIREIIAVKPDEYWIASQSGIYILNLKTGMYKHLTREQNDPYSLSDNIVHTLCMDKEGGIWAGTYFGGINYFPKQYITFRKYFPRSCSNSISGYAVREICNDKNGDIWIGTEDAGLNKFDPVTGLFINFNAGTNKKSLSFSNIHGLLVNDDKVWVGTYLHGLDVLDVKTGKKIRHYTTSNSAIGSNFIYGIFKTRSNQVIVITDKGLYDYLPDIDDFRIVKTVKKVFYRTLCEDRDGTIWAGTYGDGVFYYNTKTGKHGQFTFEAGVPYSLPSNLINKIIEDGNGNIWLATDGGLCKYEKKLDRFEKYTIINGMPSNIMYSILEDKNQNLWVSTSKGLVCFSLVTKAIKIYTKSDGLLTDQFNYNSAYRDDNGQMYFGSVKGLITFYPDSIENDTFSPPVFLTGFQVYNKELNIDGKNSPLKNSISFTKTIKLPYSQSSFSIDFAALSYTAPATNKYAYKMDGLDKEWTHLETNRRAYFTGLNPGTYTFKVSALSGNTGKYGSPAVLSITILPPLWKTWLAYTLYVIMIVTLSYIIIQYFISRAKEKNKRKIEKLKFEKEQENFRDKMEFFTNIAHEIRTPLTLIKGPMENIMDRADEMPSIKANLEIMNKNTERLLHLSKQLLDFRKVEMNGFQLKLLREDVSGLLSDHHISFKNIAEQKKIYLAVNYPKCFYAYIDAEAFNKIVGNLWDNALKYAKSAVQVSLLTFNDSNGMFIITFKNDGFLLPPGMSETVFKSFFRAKETAGLPGTGIGLTLSRSLAEIHGGTLKMDFSDVYMNTFILTLPVNPHKPDKKESPYYM